MVPRNNCREWREERSEDITTSLFVVKIIPIPVTVHEVPRIYSKQHISSTTVIDHVRDLDELRGPMNATRYLFQQYIRTHTRQTHTRCYTRTHTRADVKHSQSKSIHRLNTDARTSQDTYTQCIHTQDTQSKPPPTHTYYMHTTSCSHTRFTQKIHKHTMTKSSISKLKFYCYFYYYGGPY